MDTQELLEKNRYFNVDYDWWEDEYSLFMDKMEERGITILSPKDICFSGFCSQGDGASFTGYIHRTDLSRFIELHKLSEGYAATYYLAKLEEIDIKLVRRHSMYCHSNTVVLDIEDMGTSALEERGKDDFRQVIQATMFTQYLKELNSFEEEVINICRSYMDQLYDQLERQYNYLTSDEAILESLEMNNLYIPRKLTA